MSIVTGACGGTRSLEEGVTIGHFLRIGSIFVFGEGEAAYFRCSLRGLVVLVGSIGSFGSEFGGQMIGREEVYYARSYVGGRVDQNGAART